MERGAAGEQPDRQPLFRHDEYKLISDPDKNEKTAFANCSYIQYSDINQL